ncbi:MAG: FtsQ-type POTRA domain-containing protein [Armatimonadota bacterium]|nr:FtsQ-type POTRA domain-containing protein [Armatimonadota bacterium]MDR7534348.1 FtsQ-type POTRA domain-containing protein [Armatimonadota bacterium]MDR7536016.1 FtsQ-type POTRA domain-containing protein [Armatimonadota bacterium]
MIATLRFSLVMATLLAALMLPQSAFFDVRRIVVTGAHTLLPEDVAATAGVQYGRPLFAVRPAEATARLQAHPRIRAARVQVRWPETVVIDLTERVPRLAVRVGPRYALVADDDVVVALADGPGGLPWLDDRAGRTAGVRPGARIASPTMRAMHVVVEALPEAMRARLLRVIVQDGGDLVVEFAPGLLVRAAVRADLAERLALLPRALEALQARGIVAKVIDLRYAGSLVVTPWREGDGPQVWNSRPDLGAGDSITHYR